VLDDLLLTPPHSLTTTALLASVFPRRARPDPFLQPSQSQAAGLVRPLYDVALSRLGSQPPSHLNTRADIQQIRHSRCPRLFVAILRPCSPVLRKRAGRQ
jgi:hypothetical protein